MCVLPCINDAKNIFLIIIKSLITTENVLYLKLLTASVSCVVYEPDGFFEAVQKIVIFFS